MRSSANLCAYSDMPSFLSQSAICCMAVTEIPSGPDRVFPPREQRVYTDKSARAAKAPTPVGSHTLPCEGLTANTRAGRPGRWLMPHRWLDRARRNKPCLLMSWWQRGDFHIGCFDLVHDDARPNVSVNQAPVRH